MMAISIRVSFVVAFRPCAGASMREEVPTAMPTRAPASTSRPATRPSRAIKTLSRAWRHPDQIGRDRRVRRPVPAAGFGRQASPGRVGGRGRHEDPDRRRTRALRRRRPRSGKPLRQRHTGVNASPLFFLGLFRGGEARSRCGGGHRAGMRRRVPRARLRAARRRNRGDARAVRAAATSISPARSSASVGGGCIPESRPLRPGDAVVGLSGRSGCTRTDTRWRAR